MPVDDFYMDFARANFGDAVAEPAGRLLAGIDGVRMPEVGSWIKGPGGLAPDITAWSEVRKLFAFVDQLAALRGKIVGIGNLERFDYWLNTYQAMEAMAEARCIRGQLDKAMVAKKYEDALAARIALGKAWARLLTLQTAIVSTPGELGTIANLEQHTRVQLKFVEAHDATLEKVLGRPLPAEAQPGREYAGPARIIVPTVRTCVDEGDSLRLKFMVLAGAEPVIHLRPLGKGDWQTIRARHLGRAAYEAHLPAAHEDFEYYISAGEKLVWPATAPQISQTVVSLESNPQPVHRDGMKPPGA